MYPNNRNLYFNTTDAKLIDDRNIETLKETLRVLSKKEIKEDTINYIALGIMHFIELNHNEAYSWPGLGSMEPASVKPHEIITHLLKNKQITSPQEVFCCLTVTMIDTIIRKTIQELQYPKKNNPSEELQRAYNYTMSPAWLISSYHFPDYVQDGIKKFQRCRDSLTLKCDLTKPYDLKKLEIKLIEHFKTHNDLDKLCNMATNTRCHIC